MKRVSSLWRLVPLFAGVALIAAGCGIENVSALRPKGPVAREQFWLMGYSLAIMAVVIIVVFALTAIVLIRFRHRKGQTGIPEQVEGNHKLEIIWTVIPLVLLFTLAIPTVVSVFKLADDYRDDPDAVHVKVTSNQYWWQFEYVDLGITTAQELVIPIGKKIPLDLISNDVNHSFWVPSLAGKTDAFPGNPLEIDSDVQNNTNYMYIEAEEPGTYQGFCAELCGWSHAFMLFTVKALSEDDFNAWVDDIKAPAVVVEDVSSGEAIFKLQCLACHAVDSTSPPTFGPNLDGFADRPKVAGFKDNTDEWLRKWIVDPDSIKPQSKMPPFNNLSDSDLDDLIVYLRSLTIEK